MISSDQIGDVPLYTEGAGSLAQDGMLSGQGWGVVDFGGFKVLSRACRACFPTHVLGQVFLLPCAGQYGVFRVSCSNRPYYIMHTNICAISLVETMSRDIC